MEVAESWSRTAHKGQIYAFGGDYYDEHIVPVADLATDIAAWKEFSNSDVGKIKIIALLHDAVEDTDVTLEQVSETFGTYIADAVDCLTKKKGMTREQQWAMALRHPFSKVVKQADMLLNLRTSVITSNQRLVEKYTSGLKYLNNH